NPIPTGARTILADEMASVPALQDLAIRCYEGGVAAALNDPQPRYSSSPDNLIMRLAELYERTDRIADARELLRKYAQALVQQSEGLAGWQADNVLGQLQQVGDQLLRLDAPVDAIRTYRSLLEQGDSDNDEGLRSYRLQQAQEKLQQAVQTVRAEMAPDV